MLAFLSPIIVLGIVVFVHEFGHFVAAKAVGVYAPRFSLGWGRPIFRWRRRGAETEYVISVLPIGGYVRMASRDDETASVLEGGNETVAEGVEHGPDWDPEAMVPHGPKPVPSDRWFESKPTWARVVILVAGVTMNALLTIVVSTGIFAVSGRQYVPAVVDSLVAGMPAQQAGLQHGDSIVALNGQRIKSWSDMAQVVSASAGTPVAFEIARGTQRLTVQLVPVAQEVPNPVTGKAERAGKVGAWPMNRVASEPIGFGEAVRSGWHATWAMGGSVLGVLGGLLRGTVSVSTLGGPIAIARTSVAAARSGVESLFTLIAFLSINLAVLNLLPVPILDGGQILVTVAEGVKGKPFSDRTKEWIMRAGLALIGLLFVTVMFNDLKSLVLSFMK
ncbi:MAG: RIP metalloprotease RseP [Gemmatimonadetes bacterium]|nr:RIP metalloprotease RseP [Gemmatimonadota bacterium]